MPQQTPGQSSSLTRRQYGILVAGGAAIGLGAFAVWYIRRKNLKLKPAPPPLAQLQLKPLPPDDGPASKDQNAAPPSSSTPDSTSSLRVQVAEKDADKPESTDAKKETSSNGQRTNTASAAPQQMSSTAGTGFPATYGWAQTPNEAFLVTTCAPDVTSKEVDCRIQPSRIQLTVRGESIASGELFAQVDASESLWEMENLEGKKKLAVTLVKASGCGEQAEWPTLLKGNPMPALATISV